MTKAALSLVACLVAFAMNAAAFADRTVSLTISVRCEGEPLADVPLSASTPSGGVAYGWTDQHGLVTLVVDVIDEQPAQCTVGMGVGDPLAIDAYMRARERRSELLREYVIQTQYTTQIPADAAAATMEIEVVRAVQVTARIVPPPRYSGQHLLVIPDIDPDTVTLEDGLLTISGLAPNRPRRLYILTPSMFLRELDVPDSGTDQDLGAIELPTPPLQAVVRLTLRPKSEDRRFFGMPTMERAAGATLVAVDGGLVVTRMFVPQPSGVWGVPGRKVAEITRNAPVPAGEYYIAPYYFYAGPAQVRLIEAARAGKVPEDSGVPRVRVGVGETVNIEIDAVEVEKRIMAWEIEGL